MRKNRGGWTNTCAATLIRYNTRARHFGFSIRTILLSIVRVQINCARILPFFSEKIQLPIRGRVRNSRDFENLNLDNIELCWKSKWKERFVRFATSFEPILIINDDQFYFVFCLFLTLTFYIYPLRNIDLTVSRETNRFKILFLQLKLHYVEMLN